MRQAEKMFEKGAVTRVDYEPPCLIGEIELGQRLLVSSVRIFEDGSAENECPCFDSQERGLICVHVVAVALEYLRMSYDPDREQRLLEEQRKAVRLAATEELEYIRRAEPGSADGTAARLVLGFGADWLERLPQGPVPIFCMAEVDGALLPLESLSPDQSYSFSKQDDSILYVLEDICEGPARTRAEVGIVDFQNLLDLLHGATLPIDGSSEQVTVNAAKVPSRLRVDLDRETGEIIVIVHTELPFLSATEFPKYAISRNAGWAYGAGNIWPLESILPAPFHDVYREPVVIPRPGVLRFMDQELNLLAAELSVETDLSIDLFTVDRESPRMLLYVKGSRASLRCTLYAEYRELVMIACRPHPEGEFSHPDADDLMRYTVRNEDLERAAIASLAEYGLRGDAGDDFEPVTRTHAVLNFMGNAVPALRRRGWRVEFEGRISDEMETLDFVAPVVHVEDGNDWFDIRFDFEDGEGGSLSSSEIQRAIQRGESYVERGDRTYLLDGQAINAMSGVFEDCASGEGSRAGSFRLPSIHGAYVKSSLDALDGIDVEATPTWLQRAESHNRLEQIGDVEIPDSLEKTLRPYQKEGVVWLSFLEKNHFCGILADEMGLGKTVQTLTWLQCARAHSEAQGLSTLIVCPTSLVENWAEEAARFVPDLRVQVISGPRREKRLAALEQHDLNVTSYALLRRDIEHYAGQQFAAIVLDEAQHIKNRSTQNSKATKKLNGHHRVVLTGTPIENSVSDLWSIMDFLMPGYLGAHDTFRTRYELPIGQGGRDGEEAQSRLRRKLNPFLLRRLKRDVAKDLPPKIRRVAKFTLSPDQAKVYKELLESSQRRLFDLVAKQGFQKSRMEVLTTLLRLRQVCCHLDLLKMPDLKAKEPSAKLDLFIELLNEALDGGHRILVFSQFVTMLHILRAELEERKLPYCYLDGSTKDRMGQVRKFNQERNIPVFLISLKAGGTGLNLTGADMVIHFDPWWNPAVEEQATDRAYRIGQKRTVYGIKLIARDTVEEKVLALQKKKQAVIDATLAGDEEVMKKLDWDDVKELIDLG